MKAESRRSGKSKTKKYTKTSHSTVNVNSLIVLNNGKLSLNSSLADSYLTLPSLDSLIRTLTTVLFISSNPFLIILGVGNPW